ncbi:uncharacterized protein EDB91DRAFT_34566 [Suillus paluster]|uniref:uncharacterized protein n=1 Tax=Suillus paluster TaxID=48578 RepID=UPI001B87EA01|nr:uncharacterized protein EDB91DRAFT_34566 [Suillus paluster]KAG1756756.1 hypothetical protein EDB91DRAFT_34566 [Suillus paluster]
MAQIRCMYFDESGNPRNGGCWAKQCNFIHPGDPAWDAAQVPRNAPRGRGGRGGNFGESRGSFPRGRGRGSGAFNSSNSSVALGWDTGGGSSTNVQSSGWDTGNTKDSIKPASDNTDSMWGSSSGGGGWGTSDDPWGINSGPKESSAGGQSSNDPWGSNSVTKESSAGGQGSNDPWGSSSGTKESSAGGWGNPSSGDKSSAGWGASHAQGNRSISGQKESSAGGWNDSPSSGWGIPSGGNKSSGGWGASETTLHAQENHSSSGKKEPSASAWDSCGSGWDNPSGGDKSPGWGMSGTKEVTLYAQEKRNDTEQESRKSKPVPPPPRPLLSTSSGMRAQDDKEDTRTDTRPLKMTGTNQVPMTNTKWNKKLDTIAPPHVESFEKPRVPPLQTSTLNNSMPGEPSALSSANRSEEDRADVENWRRKAMPDARGGSPAMSTVTASTANPTNRKRKHGSSEIDRKQEVWKDLIRLLDRAVRAKIDLTKAEVDRQKWKRTQKSARFSRIGEAGRIRLDGLRTELEKVCSAHSDKLTQAISELAEVGDKLRSGIDYDRRYDIEDEVTSYLREVGAWLSDIRPLLIASTSQHPPKTNNPTPDEDDTPPEEPGAIPDGLDPLRSRLDKQEELLEELRTALTLEPPKRAIATIDDKIDKKIDTLREARVEAKRARQAPPKVEIPPEAMGAIEDVSRKATELSAAMATPVNDIAHLLILQNNIQKTQASVKTENEELRQSLAKLTETSAVNRKLIEEQTENIQRLKASLEAASELRRTPPPAEPPMKVMFDELRTAVDGVVQDIVSREVVPTITRLGEACRVENQRIHGEVFETIWDLMAPSLKITEAVNRWVTRLGLPAS